MGWACLQANSTCFLGSIELCCIFLVLITDVAHRLEFSLTVKGVSTPCLPLFNCTLYNFSS